MVLEHCQVPLNTQLCVPAVGFICSKSFMGKGSWPAAEGARCTAWDPL